MYSIVIRKNVVLLAPLCAAIVGSAPSAIIAHQYLGQARRYLKQERYIESIDAATTAIAFNPALGQAYQLRADARMLKAGTNPSDPQYHDQVIEARQDIDFALKYAPGTAKLKNLAGVIHLMENDDELAASCFSEAIALKPEWSIPWSNRALARRRVGRLAESVADAIRAAELDPHSSSAHQELGRTLVVQGQHLRAVTAFTRAIEVSPERDDLYNLRANVHSALGEREKAIADYSTAIRLNPRWHVYYVHRGIQYWQNGQIEKARADADKAIKLAPDDVHGYLLRDNLKEKAPDVPAI